ncbi:DMT family transporter [Thermopolyspora sp. NPDC052614]|uniref:DMT family transporter n=1 Tax=Thermopolyspora sp. NPDC052614 TaxID=3155682 RepID=UPI00342E8270
MTRVQSPLSVRRGFVYVCIAAAAWGTGGPAASMVYQTSGLGPVTVSFWRFVCGALLLATALPFTARAAQPGAASPVGPAPRRRGMLLLIGLGMAVSQAAYLAAIAEIGVAVATVITLGASPLVVAAGARVLLGERLGRTGAVSMTVAIGGLLLLITPGVPAAPAPGASPTLGVGLALLSAVTYGGVTLLSRAFPADPYGTALWSFVVGAVVLLPVAAVQGLLPGRAAAETAALIAYLGAVPTALAYGLFFGGLSAIRATTASVLSLIEPLAATALGVLMFGERLTPAGAAGATALLVAVTCLAPRRPENPARAAGEPHTRIDDST